MHDLVVQLRQRMQHAANPAKAVPMQSYMKTDQPFYGIQAAKRQKIFRRTVDSFELESRLEYEQIVRDLWYGTYREEMYQALEVILYFKRFHSVDAWSLYEEMAFTAPWWDTLDKLASNIVGPLIIGDRTLESVIINWSDANNMWVRRASLLVHMHHKDQTNRELLAALVLKMADEEEFFIRKAIGWILRHYARTDAVWVKQFVEQHKERLSNLSVREACKHLD